MPVVTVIIPIHDSEAFLRPCLDSVAGQTLREIEIVCVDDGSTDGSAGIVREYAARDRRFVLVEQPNRGPGPARNAGLARARGEWLAILDSDDVFAPTMLARLLSAARRERADVAVSGADLSRPDVFGRTKGWAWDKLFNADYIRRQGLEFQSLAVSNDLYFTYAALCLAERTAWLEEAFVLHRKRAGSVETTRDRDPLAPVKAVRALRDRVGKAPGFADWVPEFLFWHVNRLRTREGRLALHRAARAFGREQGLLRTLRWRREEVKRWIKNLLRGGR